MQKFFGQIKPFVSKILVLSFIGLISLSGFFLWNHPSALAANDKPLITPPSGDKTELGLPEQQKEAAYEEATEALKDPIGGVEKLYEQEYQQYKASQPDKGLVESAKQIVEDITAKK